MGKKRIVLDTNVLISAFGWKGIPNKIFEQVVSGNLELITSYNQLAELKQTLDYPRLGFTEIKSRGLLFLSLKLQLLLSQSRK